MSKLNLKQYHDLMPDNQTILRNRIAQECNVSRTTVWRWVKGITIPPLLCQKKIHEITDGAVTFDDHK